MTAAEFDGKTFCKRLTTQPGIYQMFAANGKIVYIGKAKNLKNRVSSYFRKSGLSAKTQALMETMVRIDVIVTPSETEALILESHLIKKHQPRFNVLLRDDKSYPYIYVSSKHDFPRIDFYRGSKKLPGRYFGPFPNGFAVRETLNMLQKTFKIRSCKDSFYNSRSRPCLQYQIKRCTAPCVGHIDKVAYDENLRHAMLFLEGRNQEVIEDLEQRMDAASQQLDYEAAAIFRDQIQVLRKAQEQQIISGSSGDVDVVAVAEKHGKFCVEVLYVRGGRIIGQKAHYPQVSGATDADEVLNAFLPQYYLNPARIQQLPHDIILSQAASDSEAIAALLSEQAKRTIKVRSRVRGLRAKWVQMTLKNAEIALQNHLSSKATMYQRFEALAEVILSNGLPQRIECFDISHTGGEQTVASCVVFDLNGPLKSDYRRFNIKDITKGDDYAAMAQALKRRYQRLKSGEGAMPDVLLIDGGKGQLRQAEEVLEELQVSGVMVIAVAKGPTRKAGMETLIVAHSRTILNIPVDSPALHLIQHVRDEAHRFAITGHRQQRGKQQKASTLVDIEGVGPKRKQALIRRFGGLKELSRASADEIAKVPGISRALAQKIFDNLHEG